MKYKVYKVILGCSCSNAKLTKHQVSEKQTQLMSLSTNSEMGCQNTNFSYKKLNDAFIYKVVDWVLPNSNICESLIVRIALQLVEQRKL